MIGLLYALAAHALTPEEEAQRHQLVKVRAEIADQVQLSAYDLVDELVYGWLEDPVFENPTPVVLAGVTVPVGLGTGMQGLLENHLARVLGHNPATGVQLVHCPTCTELVVHSGPEGTVVSRGIDNPEVLERLGATGKHALFIDVAAQGTWLVLRARLTRLDPDLPIIWSHTLSTQASSPALLREPDNLKSAAATRQAYIDALHARGPLAVPIRFAVRTYAQPTEEFFYYTYGSENQESVGGGVPPPPFLWLQTGVELAATDARAWTGSILLGYSFIPEAYQGIMVQGRVHRLITGRVRSITGPDLYAFAGAAAISVWGPATASFRRRTLTADDIINDIDEEGPRTSFGTLQVGLDLRLGQRIGFSTFLESIPDLANSNNIGNYISVASIRFQSFGTEVTLWF